MQRVNRVEPAVPASAMQTYRLVSPPDVTYVAACEQVGCEAWRNGWDTKIDESTGLGMQQAAYIRQRSGRTFREMRTAEGLTVFRFEAHQRCFAEHRTRPEAYSVVNGDWRGFQGVRRTHTRPVDWVEDMALNLDDIRAARERG